MAGAEISKASSSSAMDIVSMAFSNVSENSNLMEVVSVVPQACDGQEVASDSTQHVVHCATQSMEVDAQRQSADIPSQNDHEQSGQIEIPLPPNAIITVNEQGEQVIELAQVVGEGSTDQTCLIENVNCVEQIEHVEQAETMSAETAPEPARDTAMSVGEDGLEALTFQGGTVGMVGNDACVPVTISLTDVQNLQQTVDGTSMVGPSGDNVQVSSAGGVTSGTSQLVPASENALFGSLANIINTSSVSTTSNSSLPIPAAGMEGVTFVSATGVPIQPVSNVRNAAETQTMIDAGPTGSPAPAAQFIHNGRNLQQINLDENLLIPTKSQFVNNSQMTTTMGVGPVINSSQVPSVAPANKTDSSSVIGNRSVFSPMTLTIRTPPGAPAVNQALINSIVNNTEVQALLKRNPGQPITIVRVPEDPLERRNNAGVVSAKIVTNSNSAASASTIPHRVGVGRPRKGHTAPVSHTVVRKRGRQPGTKLRRKEEEYVSPVSWQPVKSRTRSGRISRPPGYRTENFKSLSLTERSDNQASDVEESSDVELDAGSRVSVTLSGRVKRFKCRSCSKAYIGRGGLARHLGAEPTHGSIDSYDTMEETSPKPDGSTTEEVQCKPDDGLSESHSEANDKDATEGGAKTSKILSKSDGDPSHLVTEEDEPVVNQDNEADKPREDALGKEPQLESAPSGRRGRPPAVRHSNSSKEDPDFKPGMSSNKSNASVKSKERRKETMRQALKFLNNEDYMDVCLPRVLRNLSLWDFLISKSELDKDDTSQVLKVLQLFEELLSEVREMAVNCLEKVDDEDKQTEGIYLDEDDDLARVLEFDKGWYNVSEPPAGAVSLPFGVTSLMKRVADVMDTDEQIDEETSPMKRRKVEDGQQVQVGRQKSPPKLANSKMKPMPKLGALTDPKSITVHVHDGKVTTEPGSPRTTILRAPLQESKSSAKSDQEQPDAPNSRNELQKGLGHVTTEKPSPIQQTSKPTQLTSEQNPITSLDPEHQPGANSSTEQQSLTPLDAEDQPPSTAVESSSKKQQPQASTEPSILLQPQPPTDEPSQEDIRDGQQSAWSNEDAQEPSGIGAQFGYASQELVSLAASASSNQNDKVDQVEPSDHIHQEETSVVVPEGSTIMQMQDGTFLVQRPDGTAMQIHTPEGMTIETVQELLSMEAGQG